MPRPSLSYKLNLMGTPVDLAKSRHVLARNLTSLKETSPHTSATLPAFPPRHVSSFHCHVRNAMHFAEYTSIFQRHHDEPGGPVVHFTTLLQITRPSRHPPGRSKPYHLTSRYCTFVEAPCCALPPPPLPGLKALPVAMAYRTPEHSSCNVGDEAFHKTEQGCAADPAAGRMQRWYTPSPTTPGAPLAHFSDLYNNPPSQHPRQRGPTTTFLLSPSETSLPTIPLTSFTHHPVPYFVHAFVLWASPRFQQPPKKVWLLSFMLVHTQVCESGSTGGPVAAKHP